jgi:hypothetical protein
MWLGVWKPNSSKLRTLARKRQRLNAFEYQVVCPSCDYATR